ncbi:MAG: two-component sensor histidine kinase, partial [Paracoccaceae bacterium]
MIEAAVIDGIPLPALIVGPDDRIVAMNALATVMFGAGMIGRHHAIALRHPEVQAALIGALRDGQASVARQLVPGPSQDVVHRVTV